MIVDIIKMVVSFVLIIGFAVIQYNRGYRNGRSDAFKNIIAEFFHGDPKEWPVATRCAELAEGSQVIKQNKKDQNA